MWRMRNRLKLYISVEFFEGVLINYEDISPYF